MTIIPVESVERITELDRKQINMLVRLFGDATVGITLETLVVVLVYDFFRRSGMSLEVFTTAFTPFTAEFKQAAANIQKVIDADGTTCVLPKSFITMVDNRYITVLNADVLTQTRLWDSVEEKWTECTDGLPVFSLTLCIPALYFKAAAPHLGQQKLADMFKRARVGGY